VQWIPDSILTALTDAQGQAEQAALVRSLYQDKPVFLFLKSRAMAYMDIRTEQRLELGPGKFDSAAGDGYLKVSE
jgi:hypothetical protein